MPTAIARALLTCSFLAMVANVAAAELPQHVPGQAFGPLAGDLDNSFFLEGQFGHAVAIRNGLAFVGSPLAQASSGRVAVFTQTTAGWQRTATLAAPISTVDRHFGRTLTYRDGVLVVGSDKAAYVFRQGNGKLNFVQKLAPPAADTAVEFPMALRYEGGTLFASAYRGTGLPSVVYVFEVDATRKFVRRDRLTVAANELFGADLSMTSTALVVGSPGGRSRVRHFGLFQHGPGSAYVFRRDSTGRWRQSQRLVASRPAGGFGTAVAIDRDMIIVGAPQEDIEGGPRGAAVTDEHIAGGAAYVFVPVAGRYVETLRLRQRPDERIQYMDFGHRIAMFDTRIAIAGVQPYGTVEVVPGGFVFTYTRDGANVTPRGIAAGHSVAYSLGLFQNQLLVGTPGAERAPGAESCVDLFGCSGLARIYDVSRVTRSTLPLTYRMTHVLTQQIIEPFDVPVQLTGMNDKGEVIGYFSRFLTPATSAFLWRNGTFVTLSTAGARVRPNAINDRSQIGATCLVGINATFGDACLRLNGQFSPLQVPSDFAQSDVTDLSNEGHVLGSGVTTDQVVKRFVARNGVFAFLDPLPGFVETFSRRINDRGTIVVGWASATEGNQGPMMAAIWQNGTIMPLGLPPGESETIGMDVNDTGTVVLMPAYTWKNGAFTKLRPPDAQLQRLVALTLNNQGVAAGYAFEAPGNVVTGTAATLWLEGHGTNLNWLISAADPLRPFAQSQQAFFLNDRNQVLVSGADGRNPGISYYLLSPVGVQ